MYYYAQLNMDDIVEAIVSFAFPVTADQLIPIPSYDESLIGKRYNRETGMFEDASEGIKVTEHDKRLWDNTPISQFTFEHIEDLKDSSTTRITIPFTNNILGYTPRKVVLQFYDFANYAGVNTGKKVARSSSVIMERDTDDTRRLYVQSGNYFTSSGVETASYGEGYAQNINDTAVFQYARVRNGTYYDAECYGGQCFINARTAYTNTHFSIIEIGSFTFTQNSASFSIKVPSGYEQVRTFIHMIGWAY